MYEECNSMVCSIGQACVIAPSCRGSKNGATPGVDTCGKAEPGSESCCTTLTMPTSTTRTLDKFEITSGRIRAFIQSIPNHDVKAFAKSYATKNPNSELGKLAAEFPGYLDAMTDGKEGTDTPLAVWLGAFPQDAINKFDGCYVQPDISGAATYWQDPTVLAPYDISPPDGKRKYSQAVLDTKPANCMPPVLLATFCAWDGGELARTSDYYEVWGHTQEPVSASGGLFTRPWTTVVNYGEFNWMNGHGTGCPIAGWPCCDPNSTDDDKVPFFSFPKGSTPSEDDSPEIGAPGRFPKDVTAAKSPDGAGWMDMGGNLLEAGWPNNRDAFRADGTTKNFCNTAAPVAEGDPSYCNRDQPEIPATATSPGFPAEPRPGSLLYAGDVPLVALIGASFEGHIGYGENYFAAQAEDETKLKGYGVPAQFQYGKVGGRCARTK
jgi:hypothetical protein